MSRITEVAVPGPLRRRLRTTGLVATAAMFSACSTLEGPRAPVVQLPPAPAAATVAVDPAHRQSELASARVPVPAATPQPASLRAARASRAPRAGEAEVCGVGIVKTSREDPAGARSIPLRTRARAQVDVLQVAEQSADPRARAAALTMVARHAEIEGRPALRDAREALDRLAGMAQQSRDPVVYAMAVDSCRALTQTDQRGGACQQITGWQWAMRDPDNAVPWLSIAGWAQARRDPALEHAAMTRAAAARRVEWHMASLSDRLMEALPPETPWASRAAVSDATTSIGFHLGGMSAPGRYCVASAMRKSSDRRQNCERVATLLLERGTGLHDLGTAWRVGEELGWSQARIRRLRGEVEKLDRVVLAEQRGTYGALSCDALQRRRDWATKVEALGEVAAARQVVKAPTTATGRGAGPVARSGSLVTQASVNANAGAPAPR
jgi:hypothetical protein